MHRGRDLRPSVAALMVVTAPEFLVATVGFVRPVIAAILTVVPLLALSAHAAIIQMREIRAGMHT